MTFYCADLTGKCKVFQVLLVKFKKGSPSDEKTRLKFLLKIILGHEMSNLFFWWPSSPVINKLHLQILFDAVMQILFFNHIRQVRVYVLLWRSYETILHLEMLYFYKQPQPLGDLIEYVQMSPFLKIADCIYLCDWHNLPRLSCHFKEVWWWH